MSWVGWPAIRHTPARGWAASVSAAVTTRLIAVGYRAIHLYTEHWRLVALKSYLKLGYVPFLYAPEMAERWRTICRATWAGHSRRKRGGRRVFVKERVPRNVIPAFAGMTFAGSDTLRTSTIKGFA